MNTIVRLVLIACGVVTFSQCGLQHPIDRNDPQAWNEGLVWKPRPGSTQDFVPVDYRGPMLTGSGKGDWVTDPQDGYRFYVPAAGTKKFPAWMLRAEAGKATNDLTRGQLTTRNALKTAFFPVYGVVWIFTGDHPNGGGGTVDSSPTPDTTSSSSNCHDHGGSGDHCSSSGGGGSHGK